MEFRETLLAAQRNQQQKSSVGSSYYKARFDPPKKEQKPRDKLSANIQKFLAKKEDEERQKQRETQRKREELLAMRDPKALRKIQKTLKVIKSANKSVLADAIDRDHTAVTLEGPDQPDQDDYGYESQEAAALYEKMMQKYSKLPETPKFSSSNNGVSKDINGTRERVKHALRHEDEPVPHKRRRRTDNGDRDISPPQKYEPERRKDENTEKPKVRRAAPPTMNFNQLLQLAEKKKSEPIDVLTKKMVSEPEPERPMTKKQKREYEEEVARRQRKQMRMDAEKTGRKVSKDDKPSERDRKSEPAGFGRIPKLSDKGTSVKTENLKVHEKEREKERHNGDRERDKAREELLRREKERAREDALRKDKDRNREDALKREKDKSKLEREKIERDKLRLDKERLDRLKAERERIDREMEKLNRDREKLEKTKAKLETKTIDKDRQLDRTKLGSKERDVKKSIDLKSQNTYRIDKYSNEKRPGAPQKNSDNKLNGHSSQGKPVPKLAKEQSVNRNDIKDKTALLKQKQVNGLTKSGEASKGLQKRQDDKRPNVNGKAAPKLVNSFDFDKHVNSLSKNGSKYPPSDVKRKPNINDAKKKQKRRTVDSESEYDSEMDDFIDDGDENMDYSKHIKEIFGYDKSKYRDIDDDDDPMMESSFARQQREEYISKKFGIMEDLEDMRMEAMEKSKKKKTRRLSDD